VATIPRDWRPTSLRAEPAALDQAAFRKLLGEEGRLLTTLIKSQKITSDTLESGVRILNIASHLLQRTFFRRPALRNKTAKSPPAKKTVQLNEALNSIVGV